MKKQTYLIIFLGILILTLAGCGEKKPSKQIDVTEETQEIPEEEEATGESMIEIKKDGKIINSLEEEFDQDFYDEDGMKEYILGETADYNTIAGRDAVKVKKLDLKKHLGTVTMEYSGAEDYQEFNGYPFFCGTIEEAYEEGYNLDVELQEASGKKDALTIGRDELLQMGKRNIVIVEAPKDENLFIKTSGKILYLSGAELKKKNIAAVSDEISYIVFK